MPAFESPFRAQGMGIRNEEESWLDEEHAEAISEDANYLVECLAAIHGDIRLAKERSGLHAYMASPVCLNTDGLIELQKKHLAVNLDKAMAEETNCALCMKTSTRFTVANLLRMRPLEERMENYKGKKRVYWGAQVSPNDLELDANGNTVPKWPGTCYHLSDLPEGHQALHWLSMRQAAPIELEAHFHTVYCQQSDPNVFYNQLSHGVDLSPAGCLVSFGYIHGVRKAWQARVLDYKADGWHYYFHPQYNQWVTLGHVDPETGKTIYSAEWEGFKRVPYRMCRGANRNEVVLGFDSAVQFAQTNRDAQGRRWCFINEGWMDSGALGIPAVATLGKYLSEDQASLLADNFDRLVYVPDNDHAGESAAAGFSSLFAENHPSTFTEVLRIPESYSDPGELPRGEAIALRNRIIQS